MSDKWLWMSATELGEGIEAGAIDPRDLTEAYLAAIEAHAVAPRIYARLTRERARAEAAAAAERARLGLRRSPLDGVPISWKDLFDTARVMTVAGSALLQGRVPERDARVLANATAAGLICLGKTHLSELAFSGLGHNPVTQTPPCVNDHDAVPGGSSSGAATSVAFGLAAAGIGSDTGGSVRIPAAWNDLVGLKTTSGRLSLDGVVPLCARFDTVGPLCRSVADAAHLLAAMEGGKAPDLTGASLKGTRLLVLTNIARDELQDQPAAGFKSAVNRLQAAGALIEHGEIPALDRAAPLSSILYTTEAYGTWKDRIEAAPEKMYSEILDRFRVGAKHTGADYVAAWQKLEDCRREWAGAVAGYDAVLTPTAPNLPPKLDRLTSDHDYFVDQNLLTLRNTRIGNLMGLCGLTLPTGLPSVGLQILGRPGGEAQLLRLGAAAEAALA